MILHTTDSSSTIKINVHLLGNAIAITPRSRDALLDKDLPRRCHRRRPPQAPAFALDFPLVAGIREAAVADAGVRAAEEASGAILATLGNACAPIVLVFEIATAIMVDDEINRRRNFSKRDRRFIVDSISGNGWWGLGGG